ncbi:hypothetical protein Kpol_1052p5 [Vanderwaltozyma polyspora DSM 70294]|uniref:ER membrane protein complex subunit 10 n=1 Tax=Vanderwaltozyma polyspora (strain ATCC 22028 / DSM 70294 / BCRC 21397 / CBS 2163 / NBRC 10782 / NRRL Y-8283 / UCD 57-17) TaxID=436907 RepID=A7TM16_VANPO|nr:uncharacterized protein Kpol_1052p5 [Vanderwaltozyma polyspora DSM 70294]EDO16658.1 hypothetical protein Kpol_1052p5 [Vanderwaltozyma polyspora DSM 70294]
MMVGLIWIGLLSTIRVVLGSELSIYAQEIVGDSRRIPLAVIDYDIETRDLKVIENNDDIVSGKRYCISGDNGDCFSYMSMTKPFHYNLIIDIHDNKISKLSLAPNTDVDGIVPLIREPIIGEEATVSKLKKTTKTYKQVRDERQSVNEQSSHDTAEEDEEDNRSWLIKNWRQVLIGLLIYNFIVGFLQKKEKEQKANEKSD